MTSNEMIVELPGDRLYPEACRITPFTLSDASALSLLPKTQDTKKLFQIMDEKINLDVKKLTPQDFWFLLYWQRINSYVTFPIKLPWECPHCDTKNSDELSGSKLVIEDIDDVYETFESNGKLCHGLVVDLPSAGEKEVRLKLVGDELLVENHLRMKGISKPEPEVYETYLIACMFEPSGGTLEERYQMVKNFSAEDHFYLKGLEEQLDYGVKNYAEFTCMECKEVSKVRFQFDLVTFFPSISNKSDIRARILPRKGAKSANKGLGEGRLSKDSVHTEEAHRLPEDSQTYERSEDSRNESEKKIEMTPAELQALIQSEVSKASSKESKEVEFSSVKER